MQEKLNALEFTPIGNDRTTVMAAPAVGSAFGQTRGLLEDMLRKADPDFADAKKAFHEAAVVSRGRVGKHMTEMMRDAQKGRIITDSLNELVTRDLDSKPGAILKALALLGITDPDNLNKIMGYTRKFYAGPEQLLTKTSNRLLVAGPQAAADLMEKNPQLTEAFMQGAYEYARSLREGSEIKNIAAPFQEKELPPPPTMDDVHRQATGLMSIQGGKIMDPNERAVAVDYVQKSPLSAVEKAKALSGLNKDGSLPLNAYGIQ